MYSKCYVYKPSNPPRKPKAPLLLLPAPPRVLLGLGDDVGVAGRDEMDRPGNDTSGFPEELLLGRELDDGNDGNDGGDPDDGGVNDGGDEDVGRDGGRELDDDGGGILGFEFVAEARLDRSREISLELGASRANSLIKFDVDCDGVNKSRISPNNDVTFLI